MGYNKSDDACVYRIRDDLAIVQTVDFFPPIVDDPYKYGQIAAANALSDIYAMGASPSIALNIFCAPACLPKEDLAAILAGGADKVKEAGAVLAGGHSIEDTELKYGMCVSAWANPKSIWSNAGAKHGDALVLTKPLGSGIYATAAKKDIITTEDFGPVVEVMATLNKYAKDAAANVTINACTDITGFGLMGHAYEMAKASECTLVFDGLSIPTFTDCHKLAKIGAVTGGAKKNEEYLMGKINLLRVPDTLKQILFDPQTSGGLLFSVKKDDQDNLLDSLAKEGINACVIGHVRNQSSVPIEVSC